MNDIIVFLDEPAEIAIEQAALFLGERGFEFTHRTRYSIAFARPTHLATAGEGRHTAARHTAARHTAAADPVSDVASSSQSGAGGPPSATNQGAPPAAGQIAAVPVQLKPEWCRLWFTVSGPGPAADAVGAYVERQQERSRRVESSVRSLERGIYDEAQWPAQEAMLRGSLQKHGVDTTLIDAKIAAFQQRWRTLGRKAAQAPPE